MAWTLIAWIMAQAFGWMGLDDTCLFFDLGVFGFWFWIHFYDLTTTFDNPPGWKGFFSAYYDFDWALGIGIGWKGDSILSSRYASEASSCLPNALSYYLAA